MSDTMNAKISKTVYATLEKKSAGASDFVEAAQQVMSAKHESKEALVAALKAAAAATEIYEENADALDELTVELAKLVFKPKIAPVIKKPAATKKTATKSKSASGEKKKANPYALWISAMSEASAKRTELVEPYQFTEPECEAKSPTHRNLALPHDGETVLVALRAFDGSLEDARTFLVKALGNEMKAHAALWHCTKDRDVIAQAHCRPELRQE